MRYFDADLHQRPCSFGTEFALVSLRWIVCGGLNAEEEIEGSIAWIGTKVDTRRGFDKHGWIFDRYGWRDLSRERTH
ncbi:MAG: hypothetical protein RL240_393 [Planctomycetota bacterium]|jgi:hypothetical protein